MKVRDRAKVAAHFRTLCLLSSSFVALLFRVSDRIRDVQKMTSKQGRVETGCKSFTIYENAKLAQGTIAADHKLIELELG